MSRIINRFRAGLFVLFAILLPVAGSAAPFAAYVMDARTGKEVYSQNADTRLHPASLTKMMTLYLAFTAIEQGKVRLDTKFPVSKHAASQPPSRLGLKPGQQIELRYLIRAAAVKSANDAATTIAEGLGGGSEARFAQQMTAMAQRLGMRNSQFRNGNGLTTPGHFSSARDMSILGRHLFYDFPQYYSIFSRRAADAGIAKVSSTNRRFLDEYKGADGIKTGYTQAAGFNLTASAQRGNRRLIATVLGGKSTAHRNQVMEQLLDAGFGRSVNNLREPSQPTPQYMVQRDIPRKVQVARIEPQPAAPQPFKLSSSDRPAARASTANVNAAPAAEAAPAPARLASVPDSSARPQRRPGTSTASVATKSASRAVRDIAPAPVRSPVAEEEADNGSQNALSSSPRPARKNGRSDTVSSVEPKTTRTPGSVFVQTAKPQPETLALAGAMSPAKRQDTIILASLEPEEPAADEATQVVSRMAGTGHYGVTLGTYKSKNEAEKVLLQTALQESASFGNAGRSVADTKRGFVASFAGMSKGTAELACQRLAARQQSCVVIGP